MTPNNGLDPRIERYIKDELEKIRDEVAAGRTEKNEDDPYDFFSNCPDSINAETEIKSLIEFTEQVYLATYDRNSTIKTLVEHLKDDEMKPLALTEGGVIVTINNKRFFLDVGQAVKNNLFYPGIDDDSIKEEILTDSLTGRNGIFLKNIRSAATITDLLLAVRTMNLGCYSKYVSSSERPGFYDTERENVRDMVQTFRDNFFALTTEEYYKNALFERWFKGTVDKKYYDTHYEIFRDLFKAIILTSYKLDYDRRAFDDYENMVPNAIPIFRTISQILNNRYAVCYGYAQVFLHYLQKFNPNWRDFDLIYSTNTRFNHAWLTITLDSNEWVIESTWNDFMPLGKTQKPTIDERSISFIEKAETLKEVFERLFNDTAGSLPGIFVFSQEKYKQILAESDTIVRGFHPIPLIPIDHSPAQRKSAVDLFFLETEFNEFVPAY